MIQPSRGFLPYGRQVIDEADIAAVTAVLRSDFLTTGPWVEKFERAFAERVGAPHAVACANGTAALHLAMLALGVGPGDHVVVPSITFLATANAARFVGAEVIFADVDPNTGLMGPEHAADAVKRAAEAPVKALIPVHLAGQCADVAGIKALADQHGAKVIEDACHALGTEYTVGSEALPVGACRHCDVATFSFHPVKTIATGEGGMIATRDGGTAKIVKRLRNHGLTREPGDFVNRELALTAETPNPWYYEMGEIGFNYRLSDIHCALGYSQLSKLDGFLSTRRALVDAYREALKPLAGIVEPIGHAPGCNPGWHLFGVLIDFDQLGISRAELMRSLHRSGIGTQVHYIPVHRQPYYRNRYGEIDLPGADAYYARCLSLPLFAGMEEDDIKRVARALEMSHAP